MRRRRTTTLLAAGPLLLGTVLLGPAGPAGAAPEPRAGVAAGVASSGIDPAGAARLDAAVRDAMRAAEIPGVIAGLWIDGGPGWTRAFGTADTSDRAPMRTDLHTRIGSVTKTFTVTALLRLVDAGRVGLDDPVSRYVDGVPGGERITLRELAEMRSGLYDYAQDPGWLKALRADPDSPWTPRRLLDVAFAHPPNFAPDAKWEYSNTNIVLLGLVVERVTGRGLSEELRAEVLGPAGLRNTALPTDAAIPAPYAHGYTTFSPDGKVVDSAHWNPSWAWAAGAMTSTLADLRSWVGTLVGGVLPNGDRLLSPGTQAERLRVRPVGVPGVAYGLGIASVNGWLGHNGELPGYETVAARLPERNATLVVIVNSDTDKGGSLSTRIAAAITRIATPDHLWALPSAARPQGPSASGEPSTPSASGPAASRGR
ncbi:serine hydrolase domain-containing protein (plasmid) [Streptomyces sp. BI20]|uniref:serine hydrolase domain-containing protein n=1 Tax=Streptomyces sp. BI20 TaxID=3403460 RepID=UPI003C7082EA